MELKLRDNLRRAYKEQEERYFSKMIYRSPYDIGINFVGLMTEIEENVFYISRVFGLPLYPQYPIGPYFLDFGDPFNGIGIEVDGRECHKDKIRDLNRENEIRRIKKWSIYRIPGWMTYNFEYDYMGDDGVEFDYEKYKENSAECFLRELYRYKLKVFDIW